MLLYLVQNLNEQLKGLEKAVNHYYPKIDKAMRGKKIDFDSEPSASKKLKETHQ